MLLYRLHIIYLRFTRIVTGAYRIHQLYVFFVPDLLATSTFFRTTKGHIQAKNLLSVQSVTNDSQGTIISKRICGCIQEKDLTAVNIAVRSSQTPTSSKLTYSYILTRNRFRVTGKILHSF
nr:unnamed protein product [Callosobruchus analis]